MNSITVELLWEKYHNTIDLYTSNSSRILEINNSPYYNLFYLFISWL